MRWFRNWVGKARAAAPRSPSFRPGLERLEDRRVMNVSSAFDAHGNVMQLVVDNTGKLSQTYQGVTQVLAQDVLRAHAYRDSTGIIGTIVIYGADTNYAAYDYDHAGGHFLGFNIVDVDKAFDKFGHLQEDVTYLMNGQYSTFEYTDAGGRQLLYGTNVIAEYIHPFVNSQGGLGEEVSYFSTQSTNTLVEYDGITGGHFLANNAVADRATNVQGTSFILDVVYIGGSAFEYTPSAGTHLGDGIPI